jgi:hypothetical protein
MTIFICVYADTHAFHLNKHFWRIFLRYQRKLYHRLEAGLRTDPHYFHADPDLSFHFDVDPDPTFHFNADPDMDPH